MRIFWKKKIYKDRRSAPNPLLLFDDWELRLQISILLLPPTITALSSSTFLAL